ncbi:trypsin inhibitor like cysteine rich domain-containing protein [Ditylenchus destructor]|uniref:Trypsin inhibitor like cysteine rich domain-containing protein n=1 Tax=Ditylenchus destructor TaxID=166010 RepID=A0AAD4R941_9BILA|nr:trypsin inhibitor like cysteine rich domain-containing protein [Ditylenchus destructor]
MLDFLVKSTGLYIGAGSKINERCRQYSMSSAFSILKAIVLFSGTIIFAIYDFFILLTKPEQLSSVENLDVEGVMILFWEISGCISICFIIYWQLNGSMEAVKRIALNEKNHRYNKHRKLVITFVLFMSFMTICYGVSCVINISLRIGTSGYKLNKYVTLLQTIYEVYTIYVWNITLSIFAAVVTSIAIEFEDFNAKFEQMLELEKAMPVLNSNLCRNLLESFKLHSELTEKVLTADKILNMYTLIMTAVGIPSTIFALLTLIRRTTLIGIVYSISDLLCCISHLFGLCIIPARINTQFTAMKNQLNRNAMVWTHPDYQIRYTAKSIVDNISQSDVGITLGGYKMITNSLIFTYCSLIIPYVVLCLKIQMGTDYLVFLTTSFFALLLVMTASDQLDDLQECLDGEIFSRCAPACEPTCNDPTPDCAPQCRHACTCEPGLLRDRDGRCVSKDDCQRHRHPRDVFDNDDDDRHDNHRHDRARFRRQYLRDDPCLNVDCTAGKHCELKKSPCEIPPCPLVATCTED